MRVRERREQRHRQIEPGEPAVRLVLDVDEDLFLHHVDLVLQVLGREPHRAHPVCFEEQSELERVRRHHLEVVGEVVTRAAVQDPAVAGDE